MTDQPKESVVTKKRSDQILTKVWELSDLILENKDDVVENDARFAIYALLHSLTRANISGAAVLGVEKLPVPFDSEEIENALHA